MLDEFLSFIKDNKLISQNDHVILAVSGGVDSVVMCHLFKQGGFTFSLAHMNFGLRGKESDQDEGFVCRLAKKYGVECYVKQVETLKYARRYKISVQVAARRLRYQWFDELLLKTGAHCLATAHHLDDQVETFLINLTRGTGIAGLHGIPLRQGRVIRPLLFTGRNEVLAYAANKNLAFREDSSNRSDKYTRNRIRHKIIPHLQKINPEFRKSISETIEMICQAEIIFRQSIESKRREIVKTDNDAIYIPVNDFFQLKPIQTWAYELLAPYGFNSGNVHDIIGLQHSSPGKEILSSTHRLVRDRDYLIVVSRMKTMHQNRFEISASDLEKGISTPVNLSFRVLDEPPEEFNEPPAVAYFDMNKLEFPLILRKWKKGDFFYPLGMSNKKKLSDFFTDLKLSKIDKENVWLLCTGEDIVWIMGHRIDDRYKVGRFSGRVLRILFRNSSK